jgi:anti-sigma factor RsiW
MTIDETGPDDTDLVAYLDEALTQNERAALEGRLAAEPALRARLAALAAGDRPFRNAYDALLAHAPHDRLTGFVAGALAARRAGATPVPRRWLFPAAAAAAVALVLLGAAAGRLLTAGPNAGDAVERGEDVSPEAWREVVAEYLSLTTSQTLAAMPLDEAVLRADLAAVARRLNLDLTTNNVLLPTQELRRVELFHFDNAPLAQIAYLDEENGPIAFCILGRAGEPGDVEAERRRDMNIAYWSSSTHAFMLVGRAPPEVLLKLADTLSARFKS